MFDRTTAATLGLGLSIALTTPSIGQIHQHTPGQAIKPVQYIEKHGDREFAGRMVGKAIPHQAWVAFGLSEQQATAWTVVSHVLLSTYAVRDYVWETDEYIFDCPPGQSENAVANQMLESGVMQYVEPDWAVYPLACSNDPLLASQWQHNADRMQSCDAWDIYTGDPTVTVGICDTGLLTTHEDLALYRLEGYNAVDQLFESMGGAIAPVHPHGTWATGCAAANGNNGLGGSGVGWNLSHRMLRVSNISSGVAFTSVLRHAARTAVENGDRVASVSYGGVDNASNLTTATYIKSIGGLMVWSAGNDNRNLTLGARDADDLIVVGATDSNDNKASFSAYGTFVDVVAPGVGVLTTSTSHNSSYASVNGTSFSCPLTAGLIAVLWSADPSLTPDQVETILKSGCDDLGAAGVDDTFGYGRINAFDSLSLVVPPCPGGEILDCNGNCAPASWLADGSCDAGGRMHNGFAIDFSCSEFTYDGLDCPVPSTPSIVWRNGSTGQHAIWFMNGVALLPDTGVLPPMPSTSWTVAGTGDFNADGTYDILWRDLGTGQNRIWFMVGRSLTPTEQVITPASTAWTVAALDDFDGDGKTDIFWRNSSTGQNAMWFMDGGTLRPETGLLPPVNSQSWQVMGSGDFDADGKFDVWWRNIYNGQNAIWFMNGTALTVNTQLPSPVSTAWQVFATCDFDGDSDPDILWRNTANGQNYMWFMQGTSLAPSGAFLTTVGTIWNIVGAQDQ